MSERLFVYGSLQPGGPNDALLTRIGGAFRAAAIRGTLRHQGWGSTLGYPGLILAENGEAISGYVFTSDSLSDHWPELDRFEGDEYARVRSSVTLEDGERVDAWVYVLKNEGA